MHSASIRKHSNIKRSEGRSEGEKIKKILVKWQGKGRTAGEGGRGSSNATAKEVPCRIQPAAKATMPTMQSPSHYEASRRLLLPGSALIVAVLERIPARTRVWTRLSRAIQSCPTIMYRDPHQVVLCECIMLYLYLFGTYLVSGLALVAGDRT